MAERTQKTKQTVKQEEEITQEFPVQNSETGDLTDELDDLLEEIDNVLEENAEQFINNFVQRGGQ